MVSHVANYRLLGNTGLRVSPLCLGTMTFGTDWGWGTEKGSAKKLLMTFIEAGGNFIDTADAYTNGRSEEFLGEFISELNLRDRLVVATKFSYASTPGDPNSGGNGRKSIYRAVEGSLKRLRTDYIDLYWLHTWDRLTPIEEVLSTLNDLVRCGKVRHFGLSDVPAWYASRFYTMAEKGGMERLCALQMEYSLVSRSIEREHLALASEVGLGLCAWSPLGSGFLTGKYRRENGELRGEGRIQLVKDSGNPVFEKFTAEKNWKILETLREVAFQIGKTPADVALNWVAKRPGVTSTLIGATKLSQLESNLKAVEFQIPADQLHKLNEVSRLEQNELDHFFSKSIQSWIAGGTNISKAPHWEIPSL